MFAKLTSDFPLEKRCDICDMILKSSVFQERPVAVEFIKHLARFKRRSDVVSKHHCIKCQILHKRITEEQVRDFLGLKAE